MTEVLNNNPN